MVLDTETVVLLHFKAEIWQEREFNGGHLEIQDGRQVKLGNRDGYLALKESPSFKLHLCQFSLFCQKSERFSPLATICGVSLQLAQSLLSQYPQVASAPEKR